MTLLSISISPAVNGYILTATYSTGAALNPGLSSPTSAMNILFTDLPSIGTFLTAQQFVPLPAPPTPTGS